MKKLLFIFLLTGIVFAGFSQKKGDKIEFRLTLRDGNYMSGTSTIDNVTLETDYGKLLVPIKNITSVELGILENESKKGEIVKKAKELDNSDETIREKSYQDLVAYGITAIPTLTDYIYSEAYQLNEFNTIYTVENALRELKSLHNVSEAANYEDVLTIDYNYKMGGKSSFKNVSLKTEYGTLEIPREKIEKMDIMYIEESDGNDKQFVLLASTHISGNTNGGWLNTGIMVKPGQKINIVANGEITLASLSNNKYNPDGKAGSTNTYNYDSDYPTYGNVVYKLGESGTSVKVGSKHNSVAESSGLLYLSIYETVYNASNTGSYVIKISVK